MNVRSIKLIASSGFFDGRWYLSAYPDAAKSKIPPLLHYLFLGGHENRDPGPDFKSQWYLEAYADVRSAGLHPLIHYLRYGKNEGRRAKPDGDGFIGTSLKHPAVSKTYFDDQAERYFCISMQRTGTTSVGRFFRDFGFHWAGWQHSEKNRWYRLAYDGAFERIFSSEDFRLANAFEDSPWFFPDLYKILFHRFPNTKFILFTRDPDAWFRSMEKHSGGDVIGETRIHCKVYRRELEYYDLLHSGNFDEDIENQLFTKKTMKITGLAEHYKNIYIRHTIEVQDFFRRYSPGVLHVGKLEDPEKWQKLAGFLKIDIPEGYECHENRSNDKKQRT